MTHYHRIGGTPVAATSCYEHAYTVNCCVSILNVDGKFIKIRQHDMRVVQDPRSVIILIEIDNATN